MNIATEVVNGVTVLRLSGDLDTGTSDTAQEIINQAIDDGANNVLISLRDVGFVSSAGLRILLVAAKKMVSIDGTLRISDLNETVHDVFEISGFSSIFNVFATEQDALQDA